jgi:hypothetical protein
MEHPFWGRFIMIYPHFDEHSSSKPGFGQVYVNWRNISVSKHLILGLNYLSLSKHKFADDAQQ